MGFGRKYAGETRGCVRRGSKGRLGAVAEGDVDEKAENARVVAKRGPTERAVAVENWRENTEKEREGDCEKRRETG